MDTGYFSLPSFVIGIGETGKGEIRDDTIETKGSTSGEIERIRE